MHGINLDDELSRIRTVGIDRTGQQIGSCLGPDLIPTSEMLDTISYRYPSITVRDRSIRHAGDFVFDPFGVDLGDNQYDLDLAIAAVPAPESLRCLTAHLLRPITHRSTAACHQPIKLRSGGPTSRLNHFGLIERLRQTSKRPHLGKRKLSCRERTGYDRKTLQGPGHPNMAARGTERHRAPPRQPVGSRATTPPLPTAATVILGEPTQPAGGRRRYMAGPPDQLSLDMLQRNAISIINPVNNLNPVDDFDSGTVTLFYARCHRTDATHAH